MTIVSAVLVTVNKLSEDSFGIILKTIIKLYFCHVATFRKCCSDTNKPHMANKISSARDKCVFLINLII